MSDVIEACFEKLEVGQSYTTFNVVHNEDVIKFSEATKDVNPLHLDDDYAKTTIFGQRIAHGMLSAGYISAIFGTKFPGAGSIYMSQTLKFKAPVKIEDTVETTVTVSELNKKRRIITFACQCRVEGKIVLTGEAQLMVPEHKGQENKG